MLLVILLYRSFWFSLIATPDESNLIPRYLNGSFGSFDASEWIFKASDTAFSSVLLDIPISKSSATGSITKLYRSGDRGSPCLNPCPIVIGSIFYAINERWPYSKCGEAFKEVDPVYPIIGLFLI
ncbi:hypothetical protein AYI69_g1906 [Smittium culicis]|uniref:Uncharacterized protein n=1 Tax=Smittium culicis TaxID=133412 RepID=A0A1R1YNY6_9FUNG|nr:hypothetical protein AYI69_g1906 [Smittium culicis]